VKASALAAEQQELTILWHAGEPLAAGLDFYRQAFRETDRILGDRWCIRHSLQTNATLITEAWCDLLRANKVTVGVSLDGPAHIHDANRRTRGGRGSFRQVERGIALLRVAGIEISVLCVLTSDSLDCPDEMFHFLVDGGFRHVAFNVEEIEGTNLQSSLVRYGNDLLSARSTERSCVGSPSSTESSVGR
jgi:uncharacterized protein